MKDIKVSDDKRAQEPVSEMHCIIMIKIISNIFPSDLTVVIVGMMALRDVLVQSWVEVA